LRRGVVCFGLILAAIACGAAPATAHTPLGARGGEVLTAGSKADEVAARLRFFGPDNVNPATGEVRRDRLILSWFGVTNFADPRAPFRARTRVGGGRKDHHVEAHVTLLSGQQRVMKERC